MNGTKVPGLQKAVAVEQLSKGQLWKIDLEEATDDMTNTYKMMDIINIIFRGNVRRMLQQCIAVFSDHLVKIWNEECANSFSGCSF